MNLPGRLKSTTLGDLLGVLHRAGASGILELEEGQGPTSGRAHRIYLDGGLIDAVETELAAPRLGEILARQGLLASEALARLSRRLLENPQRRSGEILVDERLATPEHVQRGLNRQLRLRLEAVYELSEACVRFHVRAPSCRRGGPRPLTPLEFLHGRPRARHRRLPPVTYGSAQHEAAYRTLGLMPGAHLREVRAAFRVAAAKVHPDRHPEARAEERARLLTRFAELSAAYHKLNG